MALTYRQLTTGNSGDDVTKLQQALSGAGYNVAASGTYDDATAAAVRQYQGANGLDVDGVAGEQTLGKLYGTGNAAQGGQSTQATQNQYSPYTGLQGLSAGTQQQLGRYTAGYQPGEAVSASQQRLQQAEAARPGKYVSQYDRQIQDAYEKIMNRQPFSYNLGDDMLYRQYRDQYMQAGRQAMMDTTGQMAGLTGGYGNSYAATAGNQAYQQWLTRLNEQVPELYQMAADRYAQEGNDLMNQYSMARGADEDAYNRYRDAYNMWADERDAANANYWQQYQADYGRYADDRDAWMQLADAELSQYGQQQSNAYSTAMLMLQAGVMPSAELLATAGISQADASALRGIYGGGGSSGGSSGGSGRRSGGSSSGSTGDLGALGTTPDNATLAKNAASAAGAASGGKSVTASGQAALDNAAKSGKGMTGAISQLQKAGYSDSSITAAVASALDKARKPAGNGGGR